MATIRKYRYLIFALHSQPSQKLFSTIAHRSYIVVVGLWLGLRAAITLMIDNGRRGPISHRPVRPGVGWDKPPRASLRSGLGQIADTPKRDSPLVFDRVWNRKIWQSFAIFGKTWAVFEVMLIYFIMFGSRRLGSTVGVTLRSLGRA